MWSKFLAGMLGVLLLASCANAPKSLSYRQQLDIYRDMKIRLYQVAQPLKMSVPMGCPQMVQDNGIAYHRLSGYPENMRAIAQSYWGLSEQYAEIYKQQQCSIINCHAPIVLVYDKEPNAYTDGESIFVTPALLDEIDDLSLSLIIAHELAHIAMKHVEQEPSELLEREADRIALFILALAELDYRKAALQDVASRQPHSSGGQAYVDAAERADYFREVVAEIEEMQAAGRELVP